MKSMRRILRSVCLLAVCALACAAMTSLVARHAPAASAQNPGSPPDSSVTPPEQGDELGPGPEVGPEPSEPPANEPPPSEQPGAGTQSAPSTGAPSDSSHAGAPADTTHVGAPADTTHAGALADTTGGFLPAIGAKQAAEAPLDTLSLPTTTPTNSAAGPAVGGAHAAPPPAAAPPKPRTGILGVHPIAILLGLAALNYFIVKAATN
jgi:hypothetical protein